MFLDRLNAVLKAHQLPDVDEIFANLKSQGFPSWKLSHHSILDLLDRMTGETTSGHFAGTRLTMHERALAPPDPRYYHWLGANA